MATNIETEKPRKKQRTTDYMFNKNYETKQLLETGKNANDMMSDSIAAKHTVGLGLFGDSVDFSDLAEDFEMTPTIFSEHSVAYVHLQSQSKLIDINDFEKGEPSNTRDINANSEMEIDVQVLETRPKPTTGQTGNDIQNFVEFDISDIDFSTALTDLQKFNILQDAAFKPGKNWKGPLRQVGRNKRRVPNCVFDTSRFPTLSYSVKTDTILCSACCIFAPLTELFVREPHSDWSNVERHFYRHQKSKRHLEAAEAAHEFLKICEGKTESVAQQLSRAYHEKVEKN